jgi:hypothetical protein
MTENEWAKAANLRDQYWLYVVLDCATANPELLRVRNPFARLIGSAKGGFELGSGLITNSRRSRRCGLRPGNWPQACRIAWRSA